MLYFQRSYIRIKQNLFILIKERSNKNNWEGNLYLFGNIIHTRIYLLLHYNDANIKNGPTTFW